MEWFRNALKWIATDGLLHILVCYACMLTFTPIIGIWWAIGVTIVVAIAKEAYDFIKKTNNKEQVVHDLICDAIGMALAVITMLLWWVAVMQ